MLRLEGAAALLPAATRASRLCPAYPEGFIARSRPSTRRSQAVLARRDGRDADTATLLPIIDDGVRGVRFIEVTVRSHDADGGWIDVGADADRP